MSEPLLPGELRIHERFGPQAVNRGAVLWECEWDGGLFESGVMLGGIVRSGEFRGGVAWAVWWLGGTWLGGFWHHGFGPDGRYRPRDAAPGTPLPAPPEEPVEPAGARLVVYAATVFPDAARLWHACLSRALPREGVRFELFDDSAGQAIGEGDLPEVRVLKRSASRPDFQLAYDDAVRRAGSPCLAFVDTDVFWLSTAVWPRLASRLQEPDVASVACVRREAAESHGTFAVAMKPSVYRAALAAGASFAPRVARPSEGRIGQWRGDDTADAVVRAVRERGARVVLDPAAPEEVVRLDAITMTRLLGGWVGPRVLARMAASNRYFRRGCIGNLLLARVHDRLFPARAPWASPLLLTALTSALLPHPRAAAAAARDWSELSAATRRVERFMIAT